MGTNIFIRSLAFGRGLFVAVTDGATTSAILTSPEGTNWITHDAGGELLNGVADGGGLFVAVGSSIVSSTDGISWTNRAGGFGITLFSVCYGNGRFVAVGGGCPRYHCSSRSVVSADGLEWTEFGFDGRVLDCIAHGSGIFVSVGGWSCGDFGCPTPGAIAISRDGAEWSLAAGPGDFSWLRGVAYGNGSFVAVGDGGTILQSDPVISLGLIIDEFPRLTLCGRVPGTYRIERTDTLQVTNQWQTVATFVATNSPYTWIETQLSNSRHRFYRAVLLP